MMNSRALVLEEFAASIPIDLKARLVGSRILLTGASGLVGIHFLGSLLKILEERINFEIYAVIHSSLPLFLDAWKDHPQIHWLRGDLTDPQFYGSLPCADIVIHAAGYGQPSRFMEKPFATIQINTSATAALLDKVIPGGTFLFVSSSEVYSGLTSPPFVEDHVGVTTPFHPRSCYIEGKRCGEALCSAARALGIDAKAVRLSLAYGPGVRWGDWRVLFSFIERGLREGRISLLDQGDALRCFCYISDAVEMMWNILQSGKHPVYNVGGQKIYSIRELAKIIGEDLNVPVHLPSSTHGLAGAAEIVQLSVSRYESEFGPALYTDLKTGVHKTVQWYRSAEMSQ